MKIADVWLSKKRARDHRIDSVGGGAIVDLESEFAQKLQLIISILKSDFHPFSVALQAAALRHTRELELVSRRQFQVDAVHAHGHLDYQE